MSKAGYTFLELIHDVGTRDFSQRLITAGYQDLVPERKNELAGMVEQAFDLLKGSNNPRELEQAEAEIYHQIFRKTDPGFWLNPIYQHYKEETKPRRRFEIARDWIQGKRVLDFGCGDGLFSRVLEKVGYRVSLADVLDYRSPPAAHLPFTALANPARALFADGAFDAAVILSVLHHVAGDALCPLLADLRRTAKRVIIDEDGYGIPEDLPAVAELLEEDEFLREFNRLPLEEQLKRVIFMDYFANVVSAGITEMNLPFGFRTVREWWELFDQTGYRVVETRVTGFERVFFHRSCHTWFVLESK